MGPRGCGRIESAADAPLHLDGDLVALMRHGLVHLAERGGRHRRGRDTRKERACVGRIRTVHTDARSDGAVPLERLRQRERASIRTVVHKWVLAISHTISRV